MMTDLKRPIQRFKPFKATLKFEKAGDVDVDFAVEAVGASSTATSAHVDALAMEFDLVPTVRFLAASLLRAVLSPQKR
jgi:hypothetical protein